MAGSDPAARLGLAITRAREFGSRHLTEPSYVIWASVLQTNVNDAPTFLRLMHYLAELPRQTQALITATGRDDLDFIGEKLVIVQSVLSINNLIEPWRGNATKLDESLLLALRAASAVLASDRRLAAAEESQLTALLDDIGELLESTKRAVDIDPYLREFLVQNLADLDMLIRRYWLLGDSSLGPVIDRSVGGLIRLYTTQPEVAKTEHVKKFGRIAAAVALALGIANGAYQLETNISHILSSPHASTNVQQVTQQSAPDTASEKH